MSRPVDVKIYCDESCHLEHDGIAPMVLGAVWCPAAKAPEISRRLTELKARHGLGRLDELKWTKVSPAHVQPYLDVVDYFFDDDDLHFRGLVVPDKALLNHDQFGQTHDEWYYKMFFQLLSPLIDPKKRYLVSLDYKDTQGARRISKLRDVLCNNFYDFDRHIIDQIVLVKSHQVELMQVADLLIGALSYQFRGLTTNAGKLRLIDRIRQRSGYRLTSTTLLREDKFNLFVWRPLRSGQP